jgi:hypothetical protein
MNDESLERIEWQIASARAVGSPVELRSTVLGEVERELRASRWDRRLARMAAVLIAAGVGMNTVIGLRTGMDDGRFAQPRGTDRRPSLVDTAIVVAEATDVATAQRFARQMAAMSGRKLSADEAAAIDAAVRRQNKG